MIVRTGFLVLTATAVLALLPRPAHADDTPSPKPSASAADRDGVQDIMFLTETRPIFIRLRLDTGGKGFGLPGSTR